MLFPSDLATDMCVLGWMPSLFSQNCASDVKTLIHSRRFIFILFIFFSFILMPQLWPHLASKTHFLSSMSRNNQKLVLLSCWHRCCYNLYPFFFHCSPYVKIVAWSTMCRPKSAQPRKTRSHLSSS